MIIAWSDSEDFRLAKSFFDREFNRYSVTLTGSSSIFSVGKLKAIISDHRLTPHSLGLINRVRREAREFLERNEDHLQTDHFRSQLFLFNRIRSVKDGYEYDKKQAYPRTALKLGIISKKSFDSILKLSKVERLIVLGSLATKRTRYEIENGQIVGDIVTEEEETASVWRLIVSHVDEEMKQRAVNLDADFYWVDALFTSQKWKAHSKEWKEVRVSWRYDQKKKYLLFTDGRKFFIAQTNLRSALSTRSA